MRTIHKYQIARDNTVIKFVTQEGAKILHGNNQRGTFCVWVEVEDSIEAPEERSVIFVGTGWQIPERAEYVNSFLMDDGAYVFHLYEVK